MDAFQIAFSPHANRDLEKIVRYVARNNPAAAERLGLKLINRAVSLGDMQMAHIGVKVLKRPGVRKLVEGNYLIYYRIYEEQGKVRILRFWHAARNPAKLRLNV